MYEFYDFIEFLDSSQVEDCLDYAAFRIEDAAFKRITESIDINLTCHGANSC